MRLAAAVLLLAASSAFAQSLPDWAEPSAAPPAADVAPPPVGTAPPPPPPIPVDGGLALLALAGAGLAARKLRTVR